MNPDRESESEGRDSWLVNWISGKRVEVAAMAKFDLEVLVVVVVAEED